jgi:hypothetical protein
MYINVKVNTKRLVKRINDSNNNIKQNNNNAKNNIKTNNFSN